MALTPPRLAAVSGTADGSDRVTPRLPSCGTPAHLTTAPATNFRKKSGRSSSDPSATAEIRFEARPTAADSFTRLCFTLPRAASVRCSVFDVRGRCVRRVAEGEFESGPHELAWDVRDDGARRVPRGLYVIRLRVDGASRTRKVVVTR